MYPEVHRGCGNQIRRSQTTFPFILLLIHGTHLACFLVLVWQDFFVWLPTLPWNDKILHLGGYWRAALTLWDGAVCFFWKLETLSAILHADIFEELAKGLVESSSRYGHYIEISIDLLFAKRLKFFPLLLGFFAVTVFNDLSAAMKLSNSWLELSSSCSSSCKNSKNQLESLCYLFLCFVLFLRSRTFPLNMFKVFFTRHFAWRLLWRLKRNFWI